MCACVLACTLTSHTYIFFLFLFSVPFARIFYSLFSSSSVVIISPFLPSSISLPSLCFPFPHVTWSISIHRSPHRSSPSIYQSLSAFLRRDRSVLLWRILYVHHLSFPCLSHLYSLFFHFFRSFVSHSRFKFTVVMSSGESALFSLFFSPVCRRIKTSREVLYHLVLLLLFIKINNMQTD